MQTNNAVLEYCLEGTSPVENGKWIFRLKAPDGETLMESSRSFESQSKAEEGFVSMVKMIARNHYTISFGQFPS